MKKPCLALFTFFLLSHGPLPAVPAGHPDTSGPDWMPLVNKNFSNVLAPEGVWFFEDEVLSAVEDRNLYTKRVYENYIVDLEFKNDTGTNSGVILYVSDIGNWVAHSVEVQIADDYAEKWANAPPTWQCGAIFGHEPASERMVRPAGVWNRMTIYAYGPHIRVVLNGLEVININLRDFTSAKVNPDGSDVPPWLSIPKAELPTFGHIGLQGKHGDATIYFRNLRVKELE